jgi:uncharacterized protein (TIGR02147 family)
MKTALTADPNHSATKYDIPSMLRERFRSAARRNPRYSLRSFAKQLGIDHATLSQVLRKKRRLSTRALESIGKRMGLAEETIRAYERTRSKKPIPNRAQENVRRLKFDLDTFQLLSVWHHCAILELIHVQSFKRDSRWIAGALGISTEEVNVALQRLLRLGLLEMSSRDRWIDKSGDAEFQSAALTETARNQVSRDVHDLAIEAIGRIPSSHRVHRQMVVALDSKKLPQFNKLADEFMNELISLVSESESRDDVYQVEISLFPITTLKKKTGEINV